MFQKIIQVFTQAGFKYRFGVFPHLFVGIEQPDTRNGIVNVKIIRLCQGVYNGHAFLRNSFTGKEVDQSTDLIRFVDAKG